MISGSALSPWAIASNAMIYAKNFAKALDCWPTTASLSITTTSKQYHQENVLDCLRKKSIDELLSIDLNAPTHLTVFGPVIDGIVIPAHPFGLMSKPKSLFGSYELLLGVAKAESFNSFSALDEENGTELGRRDKILKTMLKNLFDSHLKELFLTIVNEYTDWASSHQHPIQSFDSMLKIFSDALIVAPTVRAGLLHTQLSSVTTFARKRTYFFTFSHQTENGDYPTKFGCIHGQDLAYLLGLPLLNGEKFSWFNTNFTNQEVMLSKRYIYYLNWVRIPQSLDSNYYINFCQFGSNTSDPNVDSMSSSLQYSSLVNRSKEINELIRWQPYDDIQQKYIDFDLQLASNDHYQAHRLSYWFNLLPQLLQSNTDRFKSINTNKLYNAQNFGYVSKLQAPISYNSHFDIEAVMDQHHDDNHDYEDDYIEGGNQTKTRNDFMKQQKFHPHNSILSNKTLANEIVGDLDAIDLNKANLQEQEEQQHHLRNQFDFFDENLENYNASFSMIVQSNDLYKWLSLIIAIGCSLLILNVLVFAGFYYHKDRDPFESKLLQSNESKEKNFKQKRPLQSSIKAANELLTRELKSIPPFNRINSISEDFSVKQNTAT
ncbi:neuroligin-2-like protein [Sarcoptes scabiei]|uniref:Neuroligin-2-like protein n=1 Tax=Sarcoptes scabiei TaxID=52283 RepID=A0A132A4I5_SARSC|nr:neuroligin-2-like protein [Sarcoptes scabiei]